MTIGAWIARLNGLSATERAERRAECALLGHDPSGEQFLTAEPIDVCWWCLDEFRQPHVKPTTNLRADLEEITRLHRVGAQNVRIEADLKTQLDEQHAALTTCQASLERLRAEIRARAKEWREHAALAKANSESAHIPRLDQRQCFGAAQAHERCADELNALLTPGEPPAQLPEGKRLACYWHKARGQDWCDCPYVMAGGPPAQEQP